jgi:hypothetical protein
VIPDMNVHFAHSMSMVANRWESICREVCRRVCRPCRRYARSRMRSYALRSAPQMLLENNMSLHCHNGSLLIRARYLVDLCINDHGSLVICRATSVRPNHLSDQNFESR